MLETIVSEKRVALPPPPPQQQQQQQASPPQPAPPLAPQQSRFKGMLARAGTLNGRKASAPAPTPQPVPVPVPNVEKALPPPFAASPSPGPGFTPSPEPRAMTPAVDPMGDNAPAPVSSPAPPKPPVNVDASVTETPLMAEPEGVDDVPPATPAKTEGPSANGGGNGDRHSGDEGADSVDVNTNGDTGAAPPVPAPGLKAEAEAAAHPLADGVA